MHTLQTAFNSANSILRARCTAEFAESVRARFDLACDRRWGRFNLHSLRTAKVSELDMHIMAAAGLAKIGHTGGSGTIHSWILFLDCA